MNEPLRVSLPDDFPAALRAHLSPPMTYPPRSLLFTEEEAVGIWVVFSGEVEVSRSSLSGKQLTISIASRGCVLGLSVTAGSTSLVAAETLTDTQLASCQRTQLQQLMSSDPSIACWVARATTRDLEASYRIVDLALAPKVMTRVAMVLLEHENELRTHREFAALAGCPRESFSRMIEALIRLGFVSSTQCQEKRNAPHRRLHILNHGKIEEIASGELVIPFTQWRRRSNEANDYAVPAVSSIEKASKCASNRNLTH